MSLTSNEVAKLLANPSGKNRAETTERIAANFKSQTFTEAEKKIAEEIFRVLVKDAEVRVREALATNLRNSPDLPRDIALSLARDVESVSMPVLKFAEILTDEDLIAILGEQSEAKASAIAQRKTVSDQVSSAVIDTGFENAVARLVMNEGADISEANFERVTKEYPERITSSMSTRSNLPPSVASKLTSLLSRRLGKYFQRELELDEDQASHLVLQVRERATVTLLEDGSSDDDLASLITELHRKGELSPSIILRAICNADFRFFEFAMAHLAGIPLDNAQKLINDKGGEGMIALLDKCKIPPVYHPAIMAAAELCSELDYGGEKNQRIHFPSRLIERVLTNFEDPDSAFNRRDAEFLVRKLKELSPAT